MAEQRAKPMGATAAAGAKRAAGMPKKSRKPSSKPKQRPLLVGTPRDRELRAALTAYKKAHAAFLTVTGERTIDAAVARSTAATNRIEIERRQLQKSHSSATAKPKKTGGSPGAPRKIIFDSSKVPADETSRSTSVRTVSGGAPGLGRRR